MGENNPWVVRKRTFYSTRGLEDKKVSELILKTAGNSVTKCEKEIPYISSISALSREASSRCINGDHYVITSSRSHVSEVQSERAMTEW